MKTKSKTIRIYVDEQRKPFVLGALICLSKQDEKSFADILTSMKKHHRLKLHAHENIKDKFKVAAVEAVKSEIAATLSLTSSIVFKRFEADEPRAYDLLISYLIEHHSGDKIEIYCDEISLPKLTRNKVLSRVSELGWYLVWLPKISQPVLVSAVDYILYYDIDEAVRQKKRR